MKRIFCILLCVLLLLTSCFANGSKEAGTASGAGIGVVGGAVGAGTVGAGIGAIVGSIVPGAGTAVGAALGAKIGVLVGSIGGGVTGGIIGNHISGDGTQFINVETAFTFSQSGSEKKETLIYGSATSDASKYFVPEFDVNKDIYLTIEMKPSLLEEANKVKDSQKSTSVEIPVTIIITNSKNIQVTHDGGMQIAKSIVDSSGLTTSMEFTIKNDPNHTRSIVLRFSPGSVGDSEIGIVYGTDDYPLVNTDCNTIQKIHYVE